MTCNEFEQGLPEFLEQGGREHQIHVNQCQACSSIVDDLRTIARQARMLQDADEPSPRVWNSIEIALRQEGLIRPQPASANATSSVSSFVRRWGRATWLVPVAAGVLVSTFILGNPRHAGEIMAGKGSQQPRILRVSEPTTMSEDDKQVLSAVARRSPMMTAAYETNLDNVNEYIRDAQATADANPNNEEAQRSLMDAYEQKSMLYDIALNHSLQ